MTKRASRSLTRSFLYGINCEGKQNIENCLGVRLTQRRKRLDMIRLLLADWFSLRLFPASHKFGLAAQGLLNRTAKESSAMGLGHAHDTVARSPASLWEWLTLLEESEEIEYRL